MYSVSCEGVDEPSVLLRRQTFLALQPDSLGYFQSKPRGLQGCVHLDIGEGYLIDVAQRVFGLNTYHVVGVGIYP